eukprot:4676378-Amphidinium_carterae.3
MLGRKSDLSWLVASLQSRMKFNPASSVFGTADWDEALSREQVMHYSTVLGQLRFLAPLVPERFDLCYELSMLSRHLSAPTLEHLKPPRRLVEYFLGTRSSKLVLPKPTSGLVANFSDKFEVRCVGLIGAAALRQRPFVLNRTVRLREDPRLTRGSAVKTPKVKPSATEAEAVENSPLLNSEQATAVHCMKRTWGLGQTEWSLPRLSACRMSCVGDG